MNIDIKEILTAAMVLFAVIDIIGSIPIILKLRKKAGHIQSEKAALVALIVMILFVFVGESILSLIGVNVYEFAVAGSFILFFIALEMILGVSIFKDDDGISAKTVSVFPLAFPLVAGPGTLTSLLALRAEYDLSNIIIAVILNILLVYIVLKTSKHIERFLGKNGIAVIHKVFGVILLAIAVKLFTANIQELFK
ncbi:multiple antibiotic resistance protein [Dokdonia sp. Hel_I_63]|jgi:multiple antibiotic resistance protein|uniref:MarC family protein n=1 Tax=unclassified Dokdonia TaxID=2615033 RepID=UPI00020A6656|nr:MULTISPECIES: MarC family protein [unclassified Dokdonia]AEE18943.1 multiple antibiotic resistance (MarC)-related protein [Dokdonia sp. 4H-3-7-5]TVZ21830.1 multiple antibiotic resistance protein [Dokdonia sp. Hel_I_63]